MTVNSIDERASKGMTPLVRRNDTGIDGDGDGELETTCMVGWTRVLSLVWWRACCIRFALGLIMGQMSVSPWHRAGLQCLLKYRKCVHSLGWGEVESNRGGLPSWVGRV